MAAIGEPPSFQMSSRRSAGRLCVSLAGDIGSRERDLVTGAIDEGEPPTELMIDLREVGFMGSAGLAILIHACHRVGHGDGRVMLVDPAVRVVRLLEACGIADHFNLRYT
jgi:anti-sigma B factor antagonist